MYLHYSYKVANLLLGGYSILLSGYDKIRGDGSPSDDIKEKMNKETTHYDATIEFREGGSAVINGLTEEQFLQLQEVLRLVEHKVPYYLTGKSTSKNETDWRTRLESVWPRIVAWMEGR